jgi:hypothetical protein
MARRVEALLAALRIGLITSASSVCDVKWILELILSNPSPVEAAFMDSA